MLNLGIYFFSFYYFRIYTETGKTVSLCLLEFIQRINITQVAMLQLLGGTKLVLGKEIHSKTFIMFLFPTLKVSYNTTVDENNKNVLN